MRADQHVDNHCILGSLHVHERWVDEQLIVAMFADHDKAIACGDIQGFNQRAIQRIANGDLLVPCKATLGNVGVKYRHDRVSGKVDEVTVKFRRDSALPVQDAA